MTKEDLEQAAEMAYPGMDEGREYGAFCKGAKFVLDQQDKDVDDIKDEFECLMYDKQEEEIVGPLIEPIWQFFLPHLNTQKEEPKGIISEWQLCPKCNGVGHLMNGYTTTALTSPCNVCNGAKVLVKPILPNQP